MQSMDTDKMVTFALQHVNTPAFYVCAFWHIISAFLIFISCPLIYLWSILTGMMVLPSWLVLTRALQFLF